MPGMGGLGAGMIYWGNGLTGQVGGLPVGICCGHVSLGVFPAAELLLFLSIDDGPGSGR